MAQFITRTKFIYLLVCFGLVSIFLSVYTLLNNDRARQETRVTLAGGEHKTNGRDRILYLKRALEVEIEAETLATNNTIKYSNNTTGIKKTGPETLHVGIPNRLKEKFPSYMIIGFGKAGTRALYDVLRLHPQLNGPEKEERFFTKKYGKGLTKYLSSFPNKPANGFLIEKSPDYILDSKVPSRIMTAAIQTQRNVNDMIFIVITRNPIDRAMSEYLEWNIQRKTSKSPPLPSFDDMVLKDGVLQTQQPFINASCYEYHIDRWLKTFSGGQMCYVDGDEFVSNPLQQIQHLENCMGLETFFSDKNFVYNKSKGFYCFTNGSKPPQCMGGTKGRPHPQIKTEVRSHLTQHFQQCNIHISQFTGFDIKY